MADRHTGLGRRLICSGPFLASALIGAWSLSDRPSGFLLCAAMAAIGATRSLLRHDSWTVADDLTTLRLGLVVVFTALVLRSGGPEFPWFAVLLGAVALALDGADGNIARRAGTTRAGGLYDETVDALFILILSVGLVPVWGWWCLVPGLMYYLFHLLRVFRPAWRRPLPASLSRRVIAAAQGILLLAAGTPVGVAVAPFGVVCAAAAVLSVLYSFGRDILWLERHRASTHDGL